MKGYWSNLTGRAWRETREAVRLDTGVRILTGIGAPVAAAILVWWATGQPALAGVAAVILVLVIAIVLFLSKLVTLRAVLAGEKEAAGAAEKNDTDRQIEALRAEIAQLKAPPPRDPDGIYQFGKLVGSVRAAHKKLQEGIVSFAAITGKPEFNPTVEFEYHDLRLVIANFAGAGTMGFGGGAPQQSFTQVTCNVLGRTS